MIHVVFQVLDLHLDEEAEAPWTFPTLVARILVKLQAVLEAVRPETLVVVQDGGLASAAAATCAALMHIHVTPAVPVHPAGAGSGEGARGRGTGEGYWREEREARVEGKTFAEILMRAVSTFQTQGLGSGV